LEDTFYVAVEMYFLLAELSSWEAKGQTLTTVFASQAVPQKCILSLVIDITCIRARLSRWNTATSSAGKHRNWN